MFAVRKSIGLGLSNNLRNRLLSTRFSQYLQNNAKNTANDCSNDDYSKSNLDKRRQWVEEFTGTNLSNLAGWWTPEVIQTEILQGNIEAAFGMGRIPLGVAGPLQVNGKLAKGEFLVPLATVEGTLVAAINRGAKAITQSGGANVCVGQQRIARVPLFILDSYDQAIKLGEWVKKNKDRIQEEVISQFSNHAKLQEIIPFPDLEALHLAFNYTTGDAVGQNSTTICTWKALKWLQKRIAEEYTKDEINIRHVFIECHVSGDKKPTFSGSLLGRGTQVCVEVTIPETTLNNILNVTSEDLMTYYFYAQRIFGRLGVPGGYNSNLCNVLTAMYIATGQDAACVGESQASSLSFEHNKGPEGGIRGRLFLPSLMVGTVGSGTALPTQRQCLDMMGCRGEGKRGKLAEIVGATCMAVELSTHAALVSGEFAESHERLGRNPKKNQETKS